MPVVPTKPVYLIGKSPERISAADREALLKLDTATIGHVLDSGFMEPVFLRHMPNARVAGTAVTVRITLPDSVMGHYALKYVRPGDILIIDRGQDQRTACWGAATAAAAAAAGLSGLIIDGATSDVADANAVGLPVWSRSISPVTTKYRGLGGEMNIAVTCGGVTVNPGDAILADENGIVVIPPMRLAEVIAEGRKWQQMEREFLDTLRQSPGLCYPDFTGASAIVEANMLRIGESP